MDKNQGLLYKHHCHSFAHPFPPTALRLEMVFPDFVAEVKDILNVKGHQNCIFSNFSVYMDFAYWWSCIRKGLRTACESGLFYFLH